MITSIIYVGEMMMHKISMSFEEGKKEKTFKIEDSLFEIGIRKGLIEKTEHGYYFIGDYEELLAFMNSKKQKTFDWLD